MISRNLLKFVVNKVNFVNESAKVSLSVCRLKKPVNLMACEKPSKHKFIFFWSSLSSSKMLIEAKNGLQITSNKGFTFS